MDLFTAGLVSFWVLVIVIYLAWYNSPLGDGYRRDEEEDDHESPSELQSSMERHPSRRGQRRQPPPVGVCHVCRIPRTLIRKSEEFSICAGCLKEALK